MQETRSLAMQGQCYGVAAIVVSLNSLLLKHVK